MLDLQSDLITTGSRIVAPLTPVSNDLPPISRLEPIFEIDGVRCALHKAEMAAVPARLLVGAPVANLDAEDCAIRSALDLVFSGF